MEAAKARAAVPLDRPALEAEMLRRRAEIEQKIGEQVKRQQAENSEKIAEQKKAAELLERKVKEDIQKAKDEAKDVVEKPKTAKPQPDKPKPDPLFGPE
jgi:hypothetical protein